MKQPTHLVRRILARAIDSIPLYLAVYFIYDAHFYLGMATLALGIFYRISMDSKGGGLGRQIMGIQIVHHRTGEAPHFIAILVRECLVWLPYEFVFFGSLIITLMGGIPEVLLSPTIFLFLFLTYYASLLLLAMNSKDGRLYYDRQSNTQVILRPQ